MAIAFYPSLKKAHTNKVCANMAIALSILEKSTIPLTYVEFRIIRLKKEVLRRCETGRVPSRMGKLSLTVISKGS